MMMDLSIVTAVIIGFLGSAHCIGMCGGIVGAMISGAPKVEQASKLSKLAYHLTYNAGRIASYTIAGALAGLVGSLSDKIALDIVVPLGELAAGLIMIALGLYLAGWSHLITRTENVGKYAWKYIQPLGKHFLPVNNPAQAFGLGLVWGWLPCGLVYSALALSVVSASPMHGAQLMLGFGLGTLPALLILGTAYQHFRSAIRNPSMRRLAGGIIILAGAYTAVSAMTGHVH